MMPGFYKKAREYSYTELKEKKRLSHGSYINR